MRHGFFFDLFSTTDNAGWELGRILWCVGTLALVGFQGFAIWKAQTFDPLQFGTAVAAILAAGGFGVAQKDKARAG